MALKTAAFSPLSSVTARQRVFLNELSTGAKTGDVLRARLRLRGWCRSRNAFYRMIRKLKRSGLITARRIPREPDEYRGAQSLYELTELGWDAVFVSRECRVSGHDSFKPGSDTVTYEDKEWRC